MRHGALWVGLLGLASWSSFARAEEPDSPTVGESAPTAETDTAQDPPPLYGMADLHLHLMVNMEFGERYYFGEFAEPLEPCGEHSGYSLSGKPKVHYKNERHGLLGPLKRQMAGERFNVKGQASNEFDDLATHPTEGIATGKSALRPNVAEPNWFGWPTHDSLGHQQAWEGWLRLAHDGLPVAAELVASPVGSPTTAEDLVEQFYVGYDAKMSQAAVDGPAGLNLAVVSLRHNWSGCVLNMSRTERRQHARTDLWPIARHSTAFSGVGAFDDLSGRDQISMGCNDRLNVIWQYAQLAEWVTKNREWVQLVGTPSEARDAIAHGRLALVVGVESSDFLNGYVDRVVLPTSPDEDAYHSALKVALNEELDSIRADTQRILDERNVSISVPDITSFTIAHQVDSLFAGAADISLDLRKSEAARFAGAKDARLFRRDLDAFFAGMNPQADLRFAHAWVDSVERQNHESTIWFALRAATARWRKFTRRKEPAHAKDWEFWQNELGLSPHGRALLDVMQQRQIPIDIAHLSDATIAAIDGTPKKPPAVPTSYPLYTSHGVPRELIVVPREQTLSAAGVGIIQAHGGMVGLRPADDAALLARTPNAPANPIANDPIWSLMDPLESDCEESSLQFAAYSLWARKVGATRIAVGSDLNGFINQVGPTGLLQGSLDPEAHARSAEWRPCAQLVRALGSESDTRGFAHIGLLPQMVLAAHGWKAPERAEAVAAADSQFRGAENYIRMWEQAQGLHRADPPMAPNLDPFVDAVAPTPWTPKGNSSFTLAAAPETPIPALRATEAVVPYRGSAPMPQFPTTVGLLIGVQAYSTQVPLQPRLALYTECLNSWTVTPQICERFNVQYQDALESSEVVAAADRVFSQFNREYPGEAEEFVARARLAFLQNPSAEGLSSASVSPQAELIIRTILTEVLNVDSVRDQRDIESLRKSEPDDQLFCFDDHSFINAPAPGFPVPKDLECELLNDVDGCENPARSYVPSGSFPKFATLKTAQVSRMDDNGDFDVPPADGAGRGDGCMCSTLEKLADLEAEQGVTLLTEFDRARRDRCRSASGLPASPR